MDKENVAMRDGGEHGDEHPGLRAGEDAALAQLLEQPVHVERVLAADPLAQRLHQMVGAADRVDRFTAAPDPLVGVDLHEQAAANVAALHVGDLECRRP